MKRLRKLVFYTFLVSTLAIIAFALWFFSGKPSKEQIAKAFPLDSFQTFSNGKKLTLYSIEPLKKTEGDENFQGYSIIGKTEIHDRSFQMFLKQSFLNDFTNTSQDSKCFNPRHGLRIFDGKDTVDLVICYECGNFVTFVGDKKSGGHIGQDSKLLLNKTLTDAGIIFVQE